MPLDIILYLEYRSYMTFSFFTVRSRPDIQNAGGDLCDDSLMIIYRSFVTMHTQHKSSLKRNLQDYVSDERGKFTCANKSELGSCRTIVPLFSQLNLAYSLHQPIYRKS